MHITKRADVCFAIFGVAFANFLAFFIVSRYIGGTAGNGAIRNGHFYVGEHGRYTEVSSAVFHYSVLHGYIAFVGVVVGVLAAGLGSLFRRRSQDYSPVTSRNI